MIIADYRRWKREWDEGSMGREEEEEGRVGMKKKRKKGQKRERKEEKGGRQKVRKGGREQVRMREWKVRSKDKGEEGRKGWERGDK